MVANNWLYNLSTLVSIVFYSLLFNINIIYSCPQLCANEGIECEHWANDNDWGCDNGYWGFGEEYDCLPCDDIGCGSQGGECEDYKGCNKCGAGYILSEFTVDCAEYNYKTCEVDPNATPGPDDETNTNGQTQAPVDTPAPTDEPELIETNYAIAKFEDNGLYGSVVVVNGHVLVYLNFSRFTFNSIDEIGGQDCVKYGLYYGIYDEWTYDDYDSYTGAEKCGIDYTGHRFDPWLACSDYSNNEYCINSPLAAETSHEGCVPPQSYLERDDDNIYTCSPYTFINNPFSCEVGDWSGKYGKLIYDEKTKSFLQLSNSPYETDSYDLSSKSVVFRCGTTRARAFCAGFEEFVPPSTTDDLESYLHPSFVAETTTVTTNEDGEEETDTNRWEYWRPHQEDSHSKIARFNDQSFIKLTYKNEYTIAIAVNSLTIPGDCGDELVYKIYDTDMCEDDGDIDSDAGFYDPTVTCNENSKWDGWLCDETDRCNDPQFSYICEVDGYFKNVDRFYCGPTDLSNKYGSIDISDSTNGWFNQTGYDSLMAPLSQLDGMSIVIECDADNEVIACGLLIDLDDNPELLDSESEDSSDDNNKKDKKNKAADENNIFGVSDTVAIIVFVLVIGILVPCIRAFWKKRNEDAIDNDNNNNSNKASSSTMGLFASLGFKKGTADGTGFSKRRNSTASTISKLSKNRRNSTASTQSARSAKSAKTNRTARTNNTTTSRGNSVTPAGPMTAGAFTPRTAISTGATTAGASTTRNMRERSISRSQSGSRGGSRAGSRTVSRANSRVGRDISGPAQAAAVGAAIGAAGAIQRENSVSRSRELSRSRSRSRSNNYSRDRSEHSRTRSNINPNSQQRAGSRRNPSSHQRVGTDSMTMAGAKELGLNNNGSFVKRPSNQNLPVIPSGYTGPRPNRY